MNGIVNPIALRALEKALQAARKGPAPRKKGDSRIADKYVIHGYAELFSELTAIGLHQGRSANSEVVAAILESLDGQERGNAMLRILIANLGSEIAQRVLSEVPTFELSACESPADFVVRFPPQLRETVRLDVQAMVERSEDGARPTMRSWILDALVAWVRIQRQQYALLTAAIEMEKGMLEGPAST